MEYFAEAKTKLQKRFWSKVSGVGDDCWIWMGRVGNKGYGQFAFRQRPVNAHRMAYVLTIGEIPEGLWILHRCDTPLCVNPTHLRTGTRSDNVADMVKRKRNSGPHKRVIDRSVGI